MAYGSSNPPVLLGDQPIAGPKLWHYVSSHTRVVAAASEFISNGKALGMGVGDHIYVHETGTSNESSDIARSSFHRVTQVSSSSVTLNVGSVISSAS
jgi:hypothetical protein